MVKRRMFAPASEIASGLIVVSVMFVFGCLRVASGHRCLLLHVVMQTVQTCDKVFFNAAKQPNGTESLLAILHSS